MKKKLFFILVIILFIIALFIGGMHVFEPQIKGIIKQYLFNKVVKEEVHLSEVVKKVKGSDLEFRCIVKYADMEDSISYDKLDSDEVKKIFHDFGLVYIENKINNPEGHYIHFQPDIIWPDYLCGFYYSEDDEAINVIEKNQCDAECEGDIPFMFHYQYKTEKIVKNWWYYEMTVTAKYEEPRLF